MKALLAVPLLLTAALSASPAADRESLPPQAELERSE
jgi:hypothetical protein